MNKSGFQGKINNLISQSVEKRAFKTSIQNELCILFFYKFSIILTKYKYQKVSIYIWFLDIIKNFQTLERKLL